MNGIQAPFVWFGGKSRAAGLIWEGIGADVGHYVEPFAGSLAVLLGRPGGAGRIETVNDADGFISNVWRAIQSAPDDVAHHADWPVSEVDLSARHLWLVARRAGLTERMQVDPDYYDAKIAGWWLWGAACWIGSGWCAGDGPWSTDGERWTREGQGVHRQRPHLGNGGQGVHRKLPHPGDGGRGVRDWMRGLCDRLRGVRVACGDWRRVVTPAILGASGGVCAVVLDPPYADTAGRYSELYSCDSLSIAHDVREWAVAHGDDPKMRIALCGYDGEHEMPVGWSVRAWKPHGGYGLQGDGEGRANAHRERIWFSPHCLSARQPGLFGARR